MEPSYAWVAQLQAGYDRAAIAGITNFAMGENLNNPIDTKQMIGGVAVTHWARVYEPIRDLIAKMKKNGFDVWIVSASPQTMIEIWAMTVDVAADHVIGIRNLQQGGLYTYDLQGCGDVPDGMNDGMGNAVGNSIASAVVAKWEGELGPTTPEPEAAPEARPT